MARKVFVEVTARHDIDGNIAPLSIQWEDGEEYEIDRVLDVCRVASLKVGGIGVRHTCKIRGHITYLFQEVGPVVRGSKRKIMNRYLLPTLRYNDVIISSFFPIKISLAFVSPVQCEYRYSKHSLLLHAQADPLRF